MSTNWNLLEVMVCGGWTTTASFHIFLEVVNSEVRLISRPISFIVRVVHRVFLLKIRTRRPFPLFCSRRCRPVTCTSWPLRESVRSNMALFMNILRNCTRSPWEFQIGGRLILVYSRCTRYAYFLLYGLQPLRKKSSVDPG